MASFTPDYLTAHWKPNGRLANLKVTSLVKETTVDLFWHVQFKAHMVCEFDTMVNEHFDTPLWRMCLFLSTFVSIYQFAIFVTFCYNHDYWEKLGMI